MELDNLLYILLGTLLAFFGFAFYWGGLRVVGMFLGGSIAALVGLILVYLTKMDFPIALAIVGILWLVGMSVGWRLLRGAHGFLVFIIGAGLGYLFVQTILIDYYGEAWHQPWMSVLAIVGGGLAGLLLFRYVIILVTAAAGAYLIYQAVESPALLVVVFFVGTLIQIALFRRFGLHHKTRVRWS